MTAQSKIFLLPSSDAQVGDPREGRLWIYDIRWTLARSTAAARTVFGPDQVRREPGRLIKRLIAVVPIGQQA